MAGHQQPARILRMHTEAASATSHFLSPPPRLSHSIRPSHELKPSSSSPYFCKRTRKPVQIRSGVSRLPLPFPCTMLLVGSHFCLSLPSTPHPPLHFTPLHTPPAEEHSSFLPKPRENVWGCSKCTHRERGRERKHYMLPKEVKLTKDEAPRC